MALRGTQKRRMLEDLFQAGAAVGAGAFLLWASRLLQDGSPGAFPPASLRSLADLQDAAGLAAGCAGLLVLAWWGVGAAAALLSALLLRTGNRRASRAVGRFSPAFLRRLAAAALGVQLAAAPVPVLASPTGSTSQVSTASYGASASGSPAADPGWNPSSSTAAARAAAHRDGQAADPAWKPSPGPVDSSLLMPGGARGEPGTAATATVRAGDTLWDLAAGQLGPLATDYEIARHWPAWHAANRSVIGPDPNHLLPGQVLAVPPPPAN